MQTVVEKRIRTVSALQFDSDPAGCGGRAHEGPEELISVRIESGEQDASQPESNEKLTKERTTDTDFDDLLIENALVSEEFTPASAHSQFQLPRLRQHAIRQQHTVLLYGSGSRRAQRRGVWRMNVHGDVCREACRHLNSYIPPPPPYLCLSRPAHLSATGGALGHRDALASVNQCRGAAFCRWQSGLSFSS
jgi:hypothetical protein